MKVVKILLGAIVGILVLMFIGSFFISANWRVSQTQVVKASPDAIYEQLTAAENWKNWSYWSKIDTTMKVTYNGTPSGVGSAYSWKSEDKHIGTGSLTISYVEPSHYVKVDLDFEGNGKGVSEYILKPVDGGTEVTTAFNSETKGPIAKWMSRLMGKSMMTKAFKESMDNMEKYLAGNPQSANKPLPADTSSVAKPL